MRHNRAVLLIDSPFVFLLVVQAEGLGDAVLLLQSFPHFYALLAQDFEELDLGLDAGVVIVYFYVCFF